MSSVSRSGLLALLLAFAAIWLGTLDYRALIRPDEGRYAEIGREMATSGDWVTPRLNGLKYFEKPPLQYWATATAYDLFGEHNWTARLWTGLTGFGGVLLLFWAGRRLYGDDTGLTAAALLGGMQWYLLNAHLNTLDTGLCFFMEATLVGFLLAQHDRATPREERAWMAVAWLAMACAVLSKGLIGIVLPGAVLVLYTLVQRDWGLWRRLHLWPGLPLFFLVAAPWFVLCGLRNEEFLRFFFIHEHFERYLSTTHNREGQWWYFIPMLVAGAVPWLLPALRLSPRYWGGAAQARPGGGMAFRPERLLAIWAVFIFVFFSASGSKLPSYILPIFPALALLFASRWQLLTPRAFTWLALPLAVIILVATPFASRMTTFGSDDMPAALFAHYVPWLYAGGTVMAAGSALSMWLAHRRSVLAATVALAFASLGSGMLCLLGHDALAPSTSAYDLVRTIVARDGPFARDVPFYSIKMYEQTLPFYMKRTVTLVDYTDEMELGLQQETSKGVPSQAAFRRSWRDLDRGYAIMDHAVYRDNARRGLPMRELGRDPRRVIVSRR
jgi:4-amino-4-deoxy-L-arabinose transferase-like glycosyltransferase